jgi:hypothetical protein
MLRALAALAALAALTASAAAQTGALPAPLRQAVAATQDAKAPYAFDLDLTTREQNWRLRFHPRATPRLQLLQPDAAALASNERRALQRMGERMEGVPWCASAEMGRVASVALLREDASTATYAFQPTRESVRGEQARQFAQHLRGEFTVTKAAPDLTRVRLYAPRAFSPMLLVNVERINITITCAVAPNGRRYAAETVSEVRGSAFGQSFNEHSTQRAHDLRLAP